ncbi:MAG: AAA family ATPase [Desulfobacteraceae bacterium]
MAKPANQKQLTDLANLTGEDWTPFKDSGRLTRGRAGGVLAAFTMVEKGVFKPGAAERAVRKFFPGWSWPHGDNGNGNGNGNGAKLERQKDRPKPPETPKGAEAYIRPEVFDEVLVLAKGGINVLLFGPAGCGKSRLAAEVARELETGFFAMSFSGGIRYAQAFGGVQLVNGHTEWVPSPLLKAIQKPGVVFLDEIFAADPEILLGLNSLLEPGCRAIETPGGRFEVHPDCRFIAAANSAGRSVNRQYTGVQRADDSLLDRFLAVNMDYDPRVEAAILAKMDLGSDERGFLIQGLTALRHKVEANNIPFDPSTRRLINAAKAFKAGLNLNRAFELAFLSTLSKAERARLT